MARSNLTPGAFAAEYERLSVSSRGIHYLRDDFSMRSAFGGKADIRKCIGHVGL